MTELKKISETEDRIAYGSNGRSKEEKPRLQIQKTYKIFIDGKFVRSESGRYYKLNDASGNFIADICRSSRKDFRDAVVAARKAQSAWASRSAYNRSQILYRIAETMEGRKEQFVFTLQKEGIEQKLASAEVQAAIDRWVYYAGWCDKYQQIFSSVNPVESSHFNFSYPEPTGVVSVIAPETSGLLGLISVIAPVIAGGNLCVVLVSEKHPMAATELAEVLHTSDVPAGVVNLLTGFGKEIIPHASSHMDVNAIVYARNNADELKSVKENASLNVKRVIHRFAGDYFNSNAQSPYFILDTCEIKTTWHPVGY